MGDAEWFIGIKFDWSVSLSGAFDCRLSQEACANVIMEALSLTECSVSPLASPFRSGFPVDAVPHCEMSSADHDPLIAKMRSWCGMLNWLSMCPHPDITAICSLLSSHQGTPSPGHLDAAKSVGKYLKATANLGLLCSSRHNAKLESFVFFLVNDLSPQSSSSKLDMLAFCNAN
jgi:hypothetical protein